MALVRFELSEYVTGLRIRKAIYGKDNRMNVAAGKDAKKISSN